MSDHLSLRPMWKVTTDILLTGELVRLVCEMSEEIQRLKKEHRIEREWFEPLLESVRKVFRYEAVQAKQDEAMKAMRVIMHGVMDAQEGEGQDEE